MVIFFKICTLTVINSKVTCISLGNIMKMKRERGVNSVVILWVWGEHAKKEREQEMRNVKKKKREERESLNFYLYLFNGE
jgi:hypothetical protein